MNVQESNTARLRIIDLSPQRATPATTIAGGLLEIAPRLLLLLILLGFGLALFGLIFGVLALFVGPGGWPGWLQGGAALLGALTGSERWFAWCLFSLAALAIALLLIPATEHLVERRNHRRYKPGGETTFRNAFTPFFDARWAFLQHVPLPDRGTVADAILVGPTGLYLLETCTNAGYTLVYGDNWRRWRWGFWRPMQLNPTRRANRKAGALAEMLRRAGIDATVERRIVWLGPGQLTINSTEVEIWKLSDVEVAIEALKRLTSLRQDRVEAIVACLAGEGTAAGR